ncbi:hypothetical protein [Marinobacter salarius]
MSGYYDRPYICSLGAYKRRGVADAALKFLSVENVPSEFRAGWNALTNFFCFNRSSQPRRFEQLVNIICYKRGPSQTGPEERELIDLINTLLGENLPRAKVLGEVNQLFSMLFAHLGVIGKVNLPPSPVFSGSSAKKIVGTPWFEKLPSDMQFWWIASSKKNLEQFSQSFDSRFVDAALRWYRETSDPKRMSSSSNLMVHYFAYVGTDSFDVTEFALLIRTLTALSRAVRSREAALSVYSEVLREEITTTFRRLLGEQEFSISDIHPVYQSEIIANRKEAGLADPNDFRKDANKLGVSGHKPNGRSGVTSLRLPPSFTTVFGIAHKNLNSRLSLDGYSLYELSPVKQAEFGTYVLTHDDLKKFIPEKLYDKHPDSLWLAHQKDWMGLKHGEKGTQKTRINALRFFNAYIFSYLPWYRENINPDFVIPKRIEDFDPNFFVRHTASFRLRYESEHPLPVTLPDFLEKLSNLGSKGEGSVNTLKSRENLLIQYFDSYIEIEGITATNPLSLMPKSRGFSYAEAQKHKADYDYWWLLKAFLVDFAWCTLLAYEEMLRASESNSAVWRQLFKKHAQDRRPYFGHVTLNLSDLDNLHDFDHETIHVLSALLCLLSQSGLRFQNAFWLDARNFDSLVPDKLKKDQLAPVFVNTDKARLKPYASHVKMEIIELLRALNRVRGKAFSDDSLPYQGNLKSKWNEIVPLFRYREGSHTETDDRRWSQTITAVITAFESLLYRASFPFESTLFPKLAGVSYDDYMFYKATRTQVPTRSFVLERGPYHEGVDTDVRPVSLFEYRTYITAHSLRMTFDSFWSNILSHETISKYHTGQTPQTVGYYSSNTPDETNQAIKIANQLGLPNQVPRQDKDAKKIIRDLKEQGISQDIVSIASRDLDDFDIGEEIRRAPDRNIAVNRTHICPYGNTCPKKIKAILDNKKLCGLCPASLSFKSDAPAIAAEIRRLGDEIADLSNTINSGDLTDGEKDTYCNKRMTLTQELAAWMCRHDYLIEMSEGEILLGEDGEGHFKRKLTYHKPDNNWSEDEIALWRIIETSEVKTLQSERLRVEARRISRKLAIRITQEVMEAIEADPVKAAALTVQKYARLQGIGLDEVVKQLDAVSNDRSGGTALLQTLTGDASDA